MIRIVAVVTALSCHLIILSAAKVVAASFRYHEDFEQKDPVQFWTTNGELEVHFKGLMEEDAHSGRRSFKLNVTLKKGTYWYWKVPLRVPAEGRLRFSGWIKVVTLTPGAGVGLGANYAFPPTSHSGCGTFETLREAAGRWIPIAGDLVQDGARRADGVVGRYVYGATGENMTVWVDRLNCLVFAGATRSDEAEQWHSVGSLIFSYANPQVGVEEPETYRRNYGLLLWKAGFDGAMDFAYQYQFAHIWNDFDHPRYRDHVFTYPTVNGVIDTLAWEGFREGVDDVRYLATLLKAIHDAERTDRQLQQVRAAKVWVEELAPSRDLETLRSEMVSLILKLRGE